MTTLAIGVLIINLAGLTGWFLLRRANARLSRDIDQSLALANAQDRHPAGRLAILDAPRCPECRYTYRGTIVDHICADGFDA
jgi:hypothetical protein